MQCVCVWGEGWGGGDGLQANAGGLCLQFESAGSVLAQSRILGPQANVALRVASQTAGEAGTWAQCQYCASTAPRVLYGNCVAPTHKPCLRLPALSRDGML